MALMNILMFILLIAFQNRTLATSEDQTLTCEQRGQVERTFLLLKPDAVRKKLSGECIERIEKDCDQCRLLAMKLVWPNITKIKTHYAEHMDQNWFQDMVDSLMSGPVIVMVWEGLNMIAVGRKNVLAIRNDYPRKTPVVGHFLNLIHGADSVDSALNEMRIWFTEDEMKDMDNYSRTTPTFWHDEEKC